ncbi:MAG: hypothetical protein N2652_06560 [Kiritimatiellae bacterium]|nr:hypothetical protein [Kiritimatiellia bacterium]
MRSSNNASGSEPAALAIALRLMLAIATLARAQAPSDGAGSDPLAFRLQAVEQAAAALRRRAADLAEELERLRADNETLRRRLDEANTRLAAVTRVAAAAEAERADLLRQARDDAARIRALEARLAAAPAAESPGTRELRSLLEQRTRELAELRRRVAELERDSRQSGAPERSPPAAPQPEEIQRLHQMFAAEKQTWKSLHELAEQQRLEAEAERDRLREELRRTLARLDDLENRLRARDEARTAGPEKGDSALREQLDRERAARELAEIKAEAFRRAWMNARAAGAEATNPPAPPPDAPRRLR